MNKFPWFEVYRVALLELDPHKVPERLALARQKLQERMKMAGLTAEEQHAISNALNTLYAVEMNEQDRAQGGVLRTRTRIRSAT